MDFTGFHSKYIYIYIYWTRAGTNLQEVGLISTGQQVSGR